MRVVLKTAIFLYLIKKHSATTTPITTTTTRDDDDERVYSFFSSSSLRSLGEDARKVHRDQSDGGETQEEQKAITSRRGETF